ncbi:MAG: hypothetical protein JWN86_292 [Planctomycetota bacterium]|nr:hypothetical protein [Planctomycetota bacterium]
MVAIVGLASSSLSAPARAQTTTFATFNQVNTSARPFTYTNKGSVGELAAFHSAVKVNFSFTSAASSLGLTNSALAGQTFTASLVELAAADTQSKATTAAGLIFQPFVHSPSSLPLIRIVADYTANNVALGIAGKILLQLKFTGLLTGPAGGNFAQLAGSTAGGYTVNYSSDVFDFSHSTANSYGLNFTNLTSPLAIAGDFLRNFSSTGSGAFGTRFAPVPEPGTLVLFGCGLIGLPVLMRKKLRSAMARRSIA